MSIVNGGYTAVDHAPAQPTWDCHVCDKPWPCDPAREQMIADMDRTQLRIYMWLRLEQAAEDMPTMPVTEFVERFLAWN